MVVGIVARGTSGALNSTVYGYVIKSNLFQTWFSRSTNTNRKSDNLLTYVMNDNWTKYYICIYGNVLLRVVLVVSQERKTISCVSTIMDAAQVGRKVTEVETVY